MFYKLISDIDTDVFFDLNSLLVEVAEETTIAEVLSVTQEDM